MDNAKLIQRAAQELAAAEYAIALTGAGISTESGINDFRGPDGIWTKHPEMEERAYGIYRLFLQNPRGYWEQTLTLPSIIGDLSSVQPNAGHYAIAKLGKMGVLKCVITQNVDNLHEKAGSDPVYDYHGNAFKLRCVKCDTRYDLDEYDLKGLLASGSLPPRCKKCNGVIKEDIVHFGEPIPTAVAEQSLNEALDCDVMLVCGTSAVVYPFANLPQIAKHKDTGHGMLDFGYYSKGGPHATIIEVNMEPTQLTREGISDYLIQGKTGEVLPAIVEEVEKLKK
jgi:NAD-dependent deacetylase